MNPEVLITTAINIVLKKINTECMRSLNTPGKLERTIGIVELL